MNVLDSDAVAKVFSKELLTLGSFRAPIAAFGRRRTYSNIVEQSALIAKVSKTESVPVKEAYGDIFEKPPYRSDLGSSEPYRSRSSMP